VAPSLEIVIGADFSSLLSVVKANCLRVFLRSVSTASDDMLLRELLESSKDPELISLIDAVADACDSTAAAAAEDIGDVEERLVKYDSETSIT